MSPLEPAWLGRLARERTDPLASTARLVADGRITCHFQPIADLRTGEVFGHEALVRGPADTPLASPDALFALARLEQREIAFELECVRCALAAWVRHGSDGKLFVNLSASALAAALGDAQHDRTLRHLDGLGLSPACLVIELTEHERVRDIAGLVHAAQDLRSQGVSLALDDFGDGRSSLRLWSELRPAVVKIDKYFTAGLGRHPDKLQTFRALLQLATTFDAKLVAEGIEDAADLHVLRDLGVHLGQGWLLGRPAPVPVAHMAEAARAVVASDELSVLPEPRWAASRGVTARQLLVEAPAVTPAHSNDHVYTLFAAADAPHALAVLDAREHPIGLIDRTQFVAQYAKPYFREVHGRSSCIGQASPAPLCIDEHTGIEELTTVLTATDQRYLRHGFVITHAGRYRGLGTGEALVRTVTESRIEAARHANPLTNLPGNIPISLHIRRLLASGRDFHVAYLDLDHFKPFNDQYGYWRGDEMIQLAARLIVAHADLQRDFVGHVGGDDFLVVFQSADWRARCEAIVAAFGERALALFDPDDRAAGGIMAEDRYGSLRFHPCTTLCAGVVPVVAGGTRGPEDIASAAAAAKRRAKHHGVGLYVAREDQPLTSEMGAL